MKKVISYISAAAATAFILTVGASAATTYHDDLTLLAEGEYAPVHFDPNFLGNHTEQERILYGILETEIAAETEAIDISAAGYTEDQIPSLRRFMQVIFNTHLMWNHIDDHVSYTVENGVVTKVNIVYSVVTISAEDHQMMQAGVNSALACIEDGMTDVEKALVLHDFLVREVDYDLNVVNGREANPDSYTMKGVFVNGIAVCQGYAMTYSYLLDLAGVESYIVSSDDMDHAWNMVKIDGSWYHVDVTWDDPTNTVEVDFCRGGFMTHQYFLRSDDEFTTVLNDPNEVNDHHYNWGHTDSEGIVIPDAAVTGTFDGYAFRPYQDEADPSDTIKVGMLNYVNGRYYYLADTFGSQTMYQSNIDRTEVEEITLPRTYDFLFAYGDKLYGSTAGFVYEVNLDGTDSRIVAAAEGTIVNFWLKQNELAYYEADAEGYVTRKVVDLVNGASNVILSDGFLFVIDENNNATLKEYAGTKTTVNIPGTVSNGTTTFTVTAVGSSVFEGNDTVQKVMMADSITSIGDRAFFQMENLTEVEFSQNLTTIGDKAFWNCYRLDNVVLHSKVTDIGDEAFAKCYSLGNVYFKGDFPSEWGKDIFLMNEKHDMPVLHYAYDKTGWDEPTMTDAYGTTYQTSAVDFDLLESGYACGDRVKWSYDKKNSVLTISGTGDMWDWGRTADGYNAAPWGDLKIEEIIIEEGVTSVGNNAFYLLSDVEEVILPDSLTSIGDYAFWCCDIEEIVIPEHVDSIGKNAFHHCRDLEEVYFEGSVPENWGENAFADNDDDLIFYYLTGRHGWTPDTWTSDNGKTYKTKSYGKISEDVNQNGITNAADAAYLFMHFSNAEEYPLASDAYDYNGDGKTDEADAQYLLWSLFK